jgi:hypothetical protein
MTSPMADVLPNHGLGDGPAPDLADGAYPSPGTPVLANRTIRPDADPEELSVFADMHWNLSPGIFEDHYTAKKLNFTGFPDQYVSAGKHYLWAELNIEELPGLKYGRISRMAVYSQLGTLRRCRAFVIWLEVRGIHRLADVTAADYDAYLADLLESDHSHDERTEHVTTVRRMWALRELLPRQARLPEPAPWDGWEARHLLGPSPRSRRIENRTPRIQAATMEPLLAWALRFTEDFSADIIAAVDEARPFFGGRCKHSRGLEARYPHRRVKGPYGGLYPDIVALLDRLRRQGRGLPGRRGDDGELELDWPHLAKLLDSAAQGIESSPHRYLFADSGLPITDGAFLQHQPTGLLDGRLWMQAINYHDVEALARILTGACFTTVSYLSGARPGEVLSLRRGCIEYDPGTRIWLMHGRKWKGARDENGAKIPEGQARQHPWVVAEPVARAVDVLERLHDSDLLFPAVLLRKSPSGKDRARCVAEISETIDELIDWVNAYCATNRRRDHIPDDPAGPIAPSRFRRTLAWFICRRPRGLVACALQYGHLHVLQSLGYSGTYASGFPDELALEEWLARLDQLQEAEQRLQTGEHVSGPAADAYRSRVTAATAKFAGRVIRSGRQAKAVLANPSLQIYPGKGMTCVFDPSQALCQMRGADTGDDRRTPDLDDCRPLCRNIARTDRDIEVVGQQAEQLQILVDDPLAPPIRHARERRRLDRLKQILHEHQPDRTDRHNSQDRQP